MKSLYETDEEYAFRMERNIHPVLMDEVRTEIDCFAQGLRLLCCRPTPEWVIEHGEWNYIRHMLEP